MQPVHSLPLNWLPASVQRRLRQRARKDLRGTARMIINTGRWVAVIAIGVAPSCLRALVGIPADNLMATATSAAVSAGLAGALCWLLLWWTRRVDRQDLENEVALLGRVAQETQDNVIERLRSTGVLRHEYGVMLWLQDRQADAEIQRTLLKRLAGTKTQRPDHSTPKL
jgi:hypothetical protein